MPKTIIHTDKAPAAAGPYSQAVVVGNTVYCAGQVGLNPTTRQLVDGGVEAQAHQVLTNLQAVLTAAGSSLDQVVKTTVFLADINHFAAMNAVYATFFTSNPPARSTIQIARLPMDALIEIECVAVLD